MQNAELFLECGWSRRFWMHYKVIYCYVNCFFCMSWARLKIQSIIIGGYRGARNFFHSRTNMPFNSHTVAAIAHMGTKISHISYETVYTRTATIYALDITDHTWPFESTTTAYDNWWMKNGTLQFEFGI